MAMDKLFKGILQYSAEQFKSVTKEAGYIYLVRTDTTKTDGDAEIWFGTRRYGNVEASKIDDFTKRIESLEGRVDAIELALGTWSKVSDDLNTVAIVVHDHERRLNEYDGLISSANQNASQALQTAQQAVVDVTEKVEAAQSAADAANDAQSAAETAEANAKVSENAAKTSENAAKVSETNAAASETAAKSAQGAAETAKAGAEAAQAAAEDAKEAAATSAVTAGEKATAADQSAKDAAASVTEAEGHASIAEGYASDAATAKAGAEAAQAAAEDAKGLAETAANAAAGERDNAELAAEAAEAAKVAAEAAKTAAEAAKTAAEASNTSATAIANKAADDAAQAKQDAAAALDSVKDGANFKGKVDVLPESFDDYNNGDMIVVGANEYIAYKPESGAPEWILLGNINPALEQITSAINELDATVEDKTKKVTVTVVETDGKLTSVTVDDTAMTKYVDDAVSAIDHRVYYGGDDAE